MSTTSIPPIVLEFIDAFGKKQAAPEVSAYFLTLLSSPEDSTKHRDRLLACREIPTVASPQAPNWWVNRQASLAGGRGPRR
jgi:hypothetical protein